MSIRVHSKVAHLHSALRGRDATGDAKSHKPWKPIIEGPCGTLTKKQRSVPKNECVTCSKLSTSQQYWSDLYFPCDDGGGSLTGSDSNGLELKEGPAPEPGPEGLGGGGAEDTVNGAGARWDYICYIHSIDHIWLFVVDV